MEKGKMLETKEIKLQKVCIYLLESGIGNNLIPFLVFTNFRKRNPNSWNTEFSLCM